MARCQNESLQEGRLGPDPRWRADRARGDPDARSKGRLKDHSLRGRVSAQGIRETVRGSPRAGPHQRRRGREGP